MTDPLFERFDRLAAADVVAMNGRDQENHSIDFKLLGSPDFGRKDAETLGRAISAFSNAEGGMVIWGVDARKDPTDEYIDQVVDTPGLANGRLVLSRLNDLTGEATAPVVVGVQHRLLTASDGREFAVTYVPQSVGGPHMCMLGSEAHRYFVRSGGRFARLEHFQIADMFGRRPAPALELSAERDLQQDFQFRLRIKNTGRGSARAPYVQLMVPAPFSPYPYGIDGNGREILPRVVTNTVDGWIYGSGAEFVIHPGLSFELSGMWLGHGPHSEAKLALASGVRVIAYRLAALGVVPVEGELSLPS